MNWLSKAADGGLDINQPLQSLRSPEPTQPQTSRPQTTQQKQPRPGQLQQGQFDLKTFLAQDAEATEIVKWLQQMKTMVKPYWNAQRLLQKKLLNAGVTNLAEQAPEIHQLFEDLNGTG